MRIQGHATELRALIFGMATIILIGIKCSQIWAGFAVASLVAATGLGINLYSDCVKERKKRALCIKKLDYRGLRLSTKEIPLKTIKEMENFLSTRQGKCTQTWEEIMCTDI